ncbi:Uncharacterised protein [Mycobacteroides abscessus subsp. abscessus]|nr:Uncharacterised protein [Mycobacteroides abscessus subsp. abscessus]
MRPFTCTRGLPPTSPSARWPASWERRTTASNEASDNVSRVVAGGATAPSTRSASSASRGNDSSKYSRPKAKYAVRRPCWPSSHWMPAMSRPTRRESRIRACCTSGSSLPSFNTARFISCQSTGIPDPIATASSQRAVFHENGHTGSSQILTSNGPLAAASPSAGIRHLPSRVHQGRHQERPH